MFYQSIVWMLGVKCCLTETHHLHMHWRIFPDKSNIFKEWVHEVHSHLSIQIIRSRSSTSNTEDSNYTHDLMETHTFDVDWLFQQPNLFCSLKVMLMLVQDHAMLLHQCVTTQTSLPSDNHPPSHDCLFLSCPTDTCPSLAVPIQGNAI